MLNVLCTRHQFLFLRRLLVYDECNTTQNELSLTRNTGVCKKKRQKTKKETNQHMTYV